MGHVMLQVFPQALFLAMSPVVIAIVILLLSSRKPIRNALAFTLPSILGSLLVGIIILLVFNGKDYHHQSTASNLTYAGQIVTAAVFLVFAFFCWWKLPKAGDSMKLPKWVTYIEEVKPRKAFIFGTILFLNNVFFTFTVAADILLAKLCVSDGVLVMVYFTLIGTIGMWIPVTYKLVSPESSTPNIERAREWFIRHNRIILILEFGIVGLMVLAKGIVGLAR